MLKKILAVLKKIWLDPVWSKVISVGVIALIVALGAYLSDYWLDYWGKITAACIRLLTFFNQGITIPLWVIIIAIPALIMAIPVIIMFLPERKPKFTRYVNDNIFDVAWHWSWEKLNHYDDKLYVIGLQARCPKCKSILEIRSFTAQFILCINAACSWKWKRPPLSGDSILDFKELEKRVRTEIDRKVTTGEF